MLTFYCHTDSSLHILVELETQLGNLLVNSIVADIFQVLQFVHHVFAYQDQVGISCLNLKHIVVDEVSILVHSKQIQFFLGFNSECFNVVEQTLRDFPQSLNTAFDMVDVFLQDVFACLLLNFQSCPQVSEFISKLSLQLFLFCMEFPS